MVEQTHEHRTPVLVSRRRKEVGGVAHSPEPCGIAAESVDVSRYLVRHPCPLLICRSFIILGRMPSMARPSTRWTIWIECGFIKISIKIDGSAFRVDGGQRSVVGQDAMKLRVSGLLAITAVALAGLLRSAQSLAQNAYITNAGSNTVSVIDTASNAVTATIPVGSAPIGWRSPPTAPRSMLQTKSQTPSR